LPFLSAIEATFSFFEANKSCNNLISDGIYFLFELKSIWFLKGKKIRSEFSKISLLIEHQDKNKFDFSLRIPKTTPRFTN